MGRLPAVAVVSLALLSCSGSSGDGKPSLGIVGDGLTDSGGGGGADAAAAGGNDGRSGGHDLRWTDRPGAQPGTEDSAHIPEKAPGQLGDPCHENSDCVSGFCIEGHDGFICTRTCIDDCPEGYACKGVANAAPDPVFVCVPDTMRLCQPCREHFQCNDGLCLDIAGGMHCTLWCDEESPCTEGFVCVEVDAPEELPRGVEGPTLSVCAPSNDACDCRPRHEGDKRPCTKTTAAGTCRGLEICDPAVGWTGCDALEAEDETCNGLDDDCDGIADDGLEAARPCAAENEHGRCEGEEVCLGSAGWVCGAAEPAPETCDFLDEDCDGETDEDFRTGARYDRYEHCGSCDTSCDAAIPNASELSCDATLEVPVCTVQSCDAGFYRANDFLCLPAGQTHCRPCTGDEQCAGGRCLELAGGRYCTSACTGEDECPEGFACEALEEDEAAGDEVRYCAPKNGTCDCTLTNPGAVRPCSVETDLGTCLGLERCEPEQGWVECSASEAQEEECNGADDDCDGLVDEDLPESQPCTRDNEHGSCAGVARCSGTLGWVCAAPEPAPETCNLLDDNCDGEVDEGFTDEQGRYSSQHNCGACGLSCVGSIAHGEGRCDGEREPPACVVEECEPGYYAASAFVCAPEQETFCQPCLGDDHCGGGVCVGLGSERFCTRRCAGDEDCPQSTNCVELDGAGEGVCLPASGTCSCVEAMRDVERACQRANEHGSCLGLERCDPEQGWVECSASEPAVEICNGVDDDCDGMPDDGIAASRPCAVENDLGRCEGEEVCLGSAGWVCGAAEPAEETCDFKDEDCDGQTDEDFRGEGRYDRYEHCGTCNKSCEGAIPNAAETICTATFEVPACTVVRCKPGFFRANDFLCLPAGQSLCRPCTGDEQCAGGLCLELAGGLHCTSACSGDDECPDGFECGELQGPGGSGDASSICLPGNGTCDCSSANADGFRPCSLQNGFGTCLGLERCDPLLGWVDCDAGEAETEVCNGVDDDCDGLIDEDLPETRPCERDNDHGSCPGVERCGGSLGWMCSAPEPAAEVCNLLDDNCDGNVDEGFTDDRGRYATDQNCGSCGLSCAGAVANGAARCDADRELPACVVESCDPGYYAASPFVCSPEQDSFCQLCLIDAHCGGGVCVEVGADRFCTRGCETDDDCPASTSCGEVEAGGARVCLPASGTCTCVEARRDDERACQQQNDHGTCLGFETCDPRQGWVGCDAATPAVEVCNGKDDDCDGSVDDGHPAAAPSHNTNEPGSSPGPKACFGTLGHVCAAPDPAPETCNFIDDNCDGQTDETYTDETGRYVDDENCGTCDRSCAREIPSAKRAACDPDRDPPRCVVAECHTGFFKLNDFQCMPESAGLCDPCIVDTNCAFDGAKCLDLPDGKACGIPCDTATDCPAGFACQDHGGSLQCTPETGSCSCSAQSGSLSRGCEVTFEPQGGGQSVTCFGTESCTDTGWGPCVLPYEVCNDKDDDCDGEIDEDFRSADGAFNTLEHCGRCRNNCASISYQNADPICDADSAAAPFCTFDCHDDFHDVNENPADGCECEFVSEEDVPADGVDTNCDGVDGSTQTSIFVAKNGDDTAPGTVDSPMLTLKAAIARAASENISSVLVATGVYAEQVELRAGVSLYGAYSSDFRQRSTVLFDTVILPTSASDALPGALNALALGGAATVVDGFSVYGPTNRNPGGSSYAVYIRDTGDVLRLGNNRVLAGDGGKGNRGGDGQPGQDGEPGKVGVDAHDIGTRECKQGHQTVGGAGGKKSCGAVAVDGGAGGDSRCPKRNPADESAEEHGRAGSNNTGEDGSGGEKGYDLSQGTFCVCSLPPGDREHTGHDGNDGTDGDPGDAGAGPTDDDGTVTVAALWQGLDGGDGGEGAPGGGGGGGGAGAGVELNRGCNSAIGDDLGGTGGGGGSGGCGATGGTGGTAGGGSFGIFVTWSAAPASVPLIESNTISPGYGGDGGNGGAGGTGGLGGDGRQGGAGGEPDSTFTCSMKGGRGGQGGDGGHGGGGGGGAGGVSFGIFASGHGGADLSSYGRLNTFASTGSAGDGGRGGPSLGKEGDDGPRGAAKAVNF